MFKADRNAAPPSSFIKTPGVYSGTIQIPKEMDCTSKGDLRIKVEFVTPSGEKVTDDYINLESMYWKLNVLLGAADPDGTKIKIVDGENLDFSQNQRFIDFLKKFQDCEISFAVFTETFTKKDGSEGTAIRVKPLDPRRGMNQLPPKARAQIEAAKLAAEGPDEVPF
jgi:hypothetical protein